MAALPVWWFIGEGVFSHNVGNMMTEDGTFLLKAGVQVVFTNMSPKLTKHNGHALWQVRQIKLAEFTCRRVCGRGNVFVVSVCLSVFVCVCVSVQAITFE